MADQIKGTQLIVEAAYEATPEIIIGGAGLGALYSIGEEIRIEGAGLSVLYSTSGVGSIVAKGLGISVAYFETPPFRRTFPTPPTSRITQSQADKRTFPILT